MKGITFKNWGMRLLGLGLGLSAPLFTVSAGSSVKQVAVPSPVLLYANKYGASLGCMDKYIEGACAERVELYPRQNDTSEATIKRLGVLVRYHDAQATILMCHGFMCNKYDQGFLRRLFPRGRYNTMSFDFRAHGELKDGQTCTFGRDEAQDVLAAAQFIKNHPELKTKPLYVYGFSMGAVAAIEAQARNPSLFDAMILDCPFDSTENVVKNILKKMKITLWGYEFSVPGCSILQKYAFHPYIQSFVKTMLKTVTNMDPRNIPTHLYPVYPAESIKKVSVPSLFIHCKKDEKIPISAMKKIYEGSGANYKVLWLTNGRQHFDSYFYSPEKYTEHVRSFLENALNGNIYKEQRQEIIEDEDELSSKEKVA